MTTAPGVDDPASPLAGTAHLLAVMDLLRSPGGCPWDAEQTHASLARYLLEETYEVLDALDSGDRALLREELGDLLLQVVFHTRIATEDAGAPFGFDDVAADVAAKLVHRHPHVFAADTPAGQAAAAEPLLTGWEQRKRVEKGRRSVFDGIPEAVPALLLATKMLDRLAASDLAVDLPPPLPLPPALPLAEPDGRAAGQESAQRAVGAALLAAVVAARQAGIEPEQALRGELRRLRAAVAAVEVLPAGSAPHDEEVPSGEPGAATPGDTLAGVDVDPHP